MREAVIVSTARTGIGRAYRGALNNIKSPTLLGHVIGEAVRRAGVEGGEIAYPVEEITIAANLKDVFRDIVAVGADEIARGTRRTGSILVGQMAVAG
jgi:predicted Zn-dependent protease